MNTLFFEVFDARWMPGVSYYSRFQDVFFSKCPFTPYKIHLDNNSFTSTNVHIYFARLSARGVQRCSFWRRHIAPNLSAQGRFSYS